jgi:predicted CopG family antitoxin
MPLTKSGNKVLSSVMSEYGEKKGKGVFYAMINKGKAGSEKWHQMKRKRKRASKYAGALA